MRVLHTSSSLPSSSHGMSSICLMYFCSCSSSSLWASCGSVGSCWVWWPGDRVGKRSWKRFDAKCSFVGGLSENSWFFDSFPHPSTGNPGVFPFPAPAHVLTFALHYYLPLLWNPYVPLMDLLTVHQWLGHLNSVTNLPNPALPSPHCLAQVQCSGNFILSVQMTLLSFPVFLLSLDVKKFKIFGKFLHFIPASFLSCKPSLKFRKPGLSLRQKQFSQRRVSSQRKKENTKKLLHG